MTLSTGFIFDCDGVLLDSIGAWHDLDATLAEEAGIVLTREDRKTLNSSTLEEAAVFFHEHFGIGDTAEEVERRFNEILFEYYRDRATEVPGALAFVRAVHQAGAPAYVLSSSPQSFLQAGLSRAGFMDYLDDVLSVEGLPYKKRDPRMYPYICDELGLDLARTWFFDDSGYAIATAHEAGMRCVGVFSHDACGTHEQLAMHSELVIDDFIGLHVEDFMA